MHRFSTFALAALIPVVGIGAQPLLLLDTSFAHGANAASQPNAVFPLAAGIPSNWTSPVNYAAGTAYFRLEILDKPTAVAIRYQPCLERGTTRACAAYQLLADSGSTHAVHTWSTALSQWTPAGMSFAAKPDRIVLIVQDAYGLPIIPQGTGNPNPNWVGQPYLQLYYPMGVRFSIALVAAGVAFPGWDGLVPVALRRAFESAAAEGAKAPMRGRSGIRFAPAGSENRWDARGRRLASLPVPER